ncbi:MAG: thioesterase [Bacteroidales bacterium]|nr:thioesterase [Bacteroidales bacterium]
MDPRKNFKAFSFMNAAQEMGHIHSTMMGEGYGDLIKSGNIWVISRAHVVFIDPPTWEQVTWMETWHRCQDGVFSIRDFEMTSEKGEKLIEATTSWVIMNMETRKLQRPDHVISPKALSLINPDRITIPEYCSKIRAPKGLELVQHHEVRISDIDYNLHSNNAKYLEWTMDCIDPEIIKETTIDEFRINFNTESTLGEIIDMYRVRTGENEFYLEGRNGNRNIFQIIIKFKSK